MTTVCPTTLYPMARKRNSRSDPACPRCGNETDLREWLNGFVYCIPCITCPHAEEGVNGVCPKCVRRLHTVFTFEGPRILNVEYYAKQAWNEYGLSMADLLTWSFAEEGELIALPGWDRSLYTSVGASAPPPHHRFG